MTPWEVTLIAIGIALGVNGVIVGRIIGEYRYRRSSRLDELLDELLPPPPGSPAAELRGETRRTWPGARKSDTEENR